MVEAGPILSAAFIAADLVDEAALFRAPKTLGADGIDALEGMPLSALTLSPKLRLVGSEQVGADTSRDVRAEVMFTGIVTDVGEVLGVEERAEGLRRLTIACAYDPRLDRDRRVDLLCRRLHDGGRDRRRRADAARSRSMPRPRRCGSPRSGAGRRARASIWSAR